MTIVLDRNKLESLGACTEGLALFDAIASGSGSIVIDEWTPLHSIWPHVSGYGAMAAWLERRGLIPRADLSGVDLSGVVLSDADLSGVDLSGAVLSGANLARTNLTGANLSLAHLARANLAGVSLAHASIARANLAGASLARANLAGANLEGTNLVSVNLSRAYWGLSLPPPDGWRVDADGYLEVAS